MHGESGCNDEIEALTDKIKGFNNELEEETVSEIEDEDGMIIYGCLEDFGNQMPQILVSMAYSCESEERT